MANRKTTVCRHDEAEVLFNAQSQDALDSVSVTLDLDTVHSRGRFTAVSTADDHGNSEESATLDVSWDEQVTRAMYRLKTVSNNTTTTKEDTWNTPNQPDFTISAGRLAMRRLFDGTDRVVEVTYNGVSLRKRFVIHSDGTRALAEWELFEEAT